MREGQEGLKSKTEGERARNREEEKRIRRERERGRSRYKRETVSQFANPDFRSRTSIHVFTLTAPISFLSISLLSDSGETAFPDPFRPRIASHFDDRPIRLPTSNSFRLQVLLSAYFSHFSFFFFFFFNTGAIVQDFVKRLCF